MNKRVGLVVGAGLLLVGIGLLLWDPESPTAPEPGPEDKPPVHRLELTQAELASAEEGGSRLVVAGTTTLLDGARLTVQLSAHGSSLLEREVGVKAGAFRLEEVGEGGVSRGDISVSAYFDLAQQSRELQEQLGFQPRTLRAEAALIVELEIPQEREEVRGQVEEAVARLNSGERDPSALDALDRQLGALERGLWLADEKLAIRELRLAIEEARKRELDREAFDRLLLRADWLLRQGR